MENETTGAVDNGDAFTAEEQALFDGQMDDGGAPEAGGGAEAPAGAEGAPVAPVPPVVGAGDAEAPVEVGDIDLDADDDGEINKGRLVRHGAFHQARQRYKAEKAARIALEAQAADLREQLARADERSRLAQPAAAAAQAAPEPETPPDPNEDIFGYAKYLEKQIQDIRAGQTQLTEAQKSEAAERTAATQRNEVLTSYQGDVRRFMATEPEFGAAYNHLLTSRMQELVLVGVPEAEALQAVRREEFEIAQDAIRLGQSPAERMMKIAKIRGYAPKAAEPAAPATPAETPAEKAARISAGQAASKSLSAAGGAPAGELTQEMLLSMSEAEFERVSQKNPDVVRRLMGG